MAKLGSYYGLCPLIEGKSLIGIAEDSEKGILIVTLGKNIASKYKLSDQKQLCCWKTKEKFTSPVIYDKRISKYLAVFNHSYIKLWDGKEENLDKLKKYKFIKPIHSVFSNDENTFVLFQSGDIYTLEFALESCKTLKFEETLSGTEQIEDILHAKVNDEFYIGLIVKSADEYYLYWTKYNFPSNGYAKLKVQRDNFSLQGYVLHVMEGFVHLLTIWSDGRIYSYLLEDSQEKSIPGELFAVIESISMKYTVCVLALDENYIAMFGANFNEEGAILLIYNTQFKVIQTKQSFKLFTNGSKMWNYENNLLLPVGQNLAAIPFYLETEQLAALVGSHKNTYSERNVAVVEELEVVSWDDQLKLNDLHVPEALTFKINSLLKQGLPESIIIEELLCEILKNQDTDSLLLCINYFLDIPEEYIAKLLNYVINLDITSFHNQSKCLSQSLPPHLQPISRIKLIDNILCKPFSEILLLPFLRIELTLSDVVTLLNYICFLWSEEDHLLPSMDIVKTHAKLIEWTSLIVDANYQKLLLSKDNCVEAILNQLYILIDYHVSSFEDLKLLSSLLNYFKLRKSYNNFIGNRNLKYSVEQICFY